MMKSCWNLARIGVVRIVSTLVLTLRVDLCATEIDSAGYISLYTEKDIKFGHAKISPRSELGYIYKLQLSCIQNSNN